MASLISRISRNYLKTNFFSGFRAPFRLFSAMDDDGDINPYRASVSILNQEQETGIFIDSYSSQGLRLSSGLYVAGPCAVFPRSILHWNVKGIQDVNEDSLTLFTLLDPKIEILVLGVGEQENISKVSPDVVRQLQKKKINVEILPTDQALAVFNFLNSERRYAAGAFIPPSYIDTFGIDDLYERGKNKTETFIN